MPNSTTSRIDQSETDSRNRRAANKAVAVSAIGPALTGFLELAVSLMTHSVGLLGDAIHNLSDVQTSLVDFLGFFITKRATSEHYSYRYDRAEDIAGLRRQ